MRIRISCSCGCSHKCERWDEMDIADMGHSEESWNQLSEDERLEAATDYVNSMGWVEIWCEEVGE